MTDVARAGERIAGCESFAPFWTCLRCGAIQGKYWEGCERPGECSECGYQQSKPKYHLFVSR